VETEPGTLIHPPGLLPEASSARPHGRMSWPDVEPHASDHDLGWVACVPDVAGVICSLEIPAKPWKTPGCRLGGAGGRQLFH
jgi:hypothetical protein